MTMTYRRQEETPTGEGRRSRDPSELYGTPQHDEEACGMDDRERYGEPQHETESPCDDDELYGEPQHEQVSADDLEPFLREDPDYEWLFETRSRRRSESASNR